VPLVAVSKLVVERGPESRNRDSGFRCGAHQERIENEACFVCTVLEF
jgi:hypothetical protein